MAAAQNNDLNAYDKLLFKHIGHVGSNKVRSFWLGLTGGRTSSAPTPRRHPSLLSANADRLSASLALLSGRLNGGARQQPQATRTYLRPSGRCVKPAVPGLGGC